MDLRKSLLQLRSKPQCQNTGISRKETESQQCHLNSASISASMPCPCYFSGGKALNWIHPQFMLCKTQEVNKNRERHQCIWKFFHRSVVLFKDLSINSKDIKMISTAFFFLIPFLWSNSCFSDNSVSEKSAVKIKHWNTNKLKVLWFVLSQDYAPEWAFLCYEKNIGRKDLNPVNARTKQAGLT